MAEGARKLRRIGSITEVGFRCQQNETLLPSNLTLAGSEFHTVGESSGPCFRFHPRNVKRVG